MNAQYPSATPKTKHKNTARNTETVIYKRLHFVDDAVGMHDIYQLLTFQALASIVCKTLSAYLDQHVVLPDGLVLHHYDSVC